MLELFEHLKTLSNFDPNSISSKCDTKVSVKVLGMRWVVNDFTRGAIRRGAGGVVEYMRAPRCEEKPR